MDGLVYNVLGLDVPWEKLPDFRGSEAGQLVLDRVRHYDVLEWLWLLNLHSSGGQAASGGPCDRGRHQVVTSSASGAGAVICHMLGEC
jgi:hypothetical protein